MPVTLATIQLSDALYPSRLREIADPPSQLYIWGDPQILQDELIVALVGSRKPTDYGLRATAHLARELANRAVVVSGLAYGIDTVALAEAISIGGRVIGVIGSGLDRASFYPASNYQLAERIVAGGGAVISEYPIGTPPLKQHFPARNRIIAGLARATVVVEAAEHSGALITAEHALEFGREVGAVPGSIFTPEAIGPNKLICEGATPIRGAIDVLAMLGIDAQLTLPNQPAIEGSIEQNILQLLNEGALLADELARELKLDSQLVGSTLTLMEIKGMVRSIGAGRFTRLN